MISLKSHGNHSANGAFNRYCTSGKSNLIPTVSDIDFCRMRLERTAASPILFHIASVCDSFETLHRLLSVHWHTLNQNLSRFEPLDDSVGGCFWFFRPMAPTQSPAANSGSTTWHRGTRKKRRLRTGAIIDTQSCPLSCVQKVAGPATFVNISASCSVVRTYLLEFQLFKLNSLKKPIKVGDFVLLRSCNWPPQCLQ